MCIQRKLGGDQTVRIQPEPSDGGAFQEPLPAGTSAGKRSCQARRRTGGRKTPYRSGRAGRHRAAPVSHRKEANRKLAESLSDTLIDYQKVQKWDGKLPTVSGGNALVSIDPAE